MVRKSSHLLTALFGFAALQAAPLAHAQSQPQAETQASRALDSLRAQYAARYRDAVTLVVIDPDRLQALPAWMSPVARYNALFHGSGLVLTPQQASQLDTTLVMRANMGPYSGANTGLSHVDLPDQDGLDHSAASAFSMTALRLPQYASQNFCMVSPAFTDFSLLTIPDLGHDRSVRFFNRHEFWHCAEDISAPQADPRIMSGRGLPLHLYQYSVDIMLAETRADMGAASDMIVHDGEGTDILPVIARWRGEQLKNPEGHDINHYSGFALAALKREIDTMGVEAWRALPDATRTATLARLTAQETMGTRALRDYLLASKNQFELPVVAIDSRLDGLRGRARDRMNAARHLAAYRASTGLGTAAPEPIELNDRQRQALTSWNAVAALENIARSGGQDISLQSLRSARVVLLDSLRAEVAANPDDPLGGAKIIKLDQAYQAVLTARFSPAPPPSAPARAPQPRR